MQRKRIQTVPESHGNLPDWIRRIAQATNVLLTHPYWEDLRYPVQGINPAGTTAPPAVDSVEAGFPGTFLFSGLLDNAIAGVAQMPHAWVEGSEIRPHVHVARTSASANAIGWELYYRRAASATGIFEAWQGPVAGTVVGTDPAVANVHYVYAFGGIDMTGYSVSTIVCWRLYRRGSTDAYADDARLFEYDIHYQANSRGSDFEYLKVD